MCPKHDTRAHFWRMLAMSRAVGVDLVEATREGWLSERSFTEAVNVCRNCATVTACNGWLDHACEVPFTPAFCPNAPVFNAFCERS